MTDRTDASQPAEYRLARAAGIVMVGFVLSTFLGLINRVLYSRVFGTSAALDAFLAANKLPDLLFNLLAGGALASAFLPTFTGYITRDDKEGAWRLASSILNSVFLVLTAAAVITWVTAPWILRVLVPGFEDPAHFQLTVSLLRIQLGAPILFGISGVLMAILNAHQHFLLPALAPTFHWLGWIFGTLVLVPRYGIHGLAWGVVLGAALHLLVQLPGIVGLQGRYLARLGWGDHVIRQVGRLMAPRLLGVAVVEINFLVNILLASFMPEGSLTGVTLGRVVMMMPQIVIAQALATAALPTFSEQAERGQRDAFRSTLGTSLRGIVFLSLPASLGLVLLRKPIVRLLFERGEFTSYSTELVAWALLWYAAGLVGHALVEILSRAFYALKDTRTPVLVGVGAMVLNVLLSIAFAALFQSVGWMPHGGLALANSLATGLESVILLWLIRNRLGGLDFHRIRSGVLATLGASAAMVLAITIWTQIMASANAWMFGLGGVGIGALVYWLAASFMQAPETRELPKILRTSTRR
jgi:putative peptidoglycan lipid II flippase